MTPALAAAAVAIPFLAALLGLFTRFSAALAVTAAAVSAGLSIAVLMLSSTAATEISAQLTPTGGVPIVLGFRVDTLAATVGVLVTLVALAVQVFSVGYFRGKPRYRSYAAMVSLFTAAMLLVVFSADLLVLYAGWEVMGLCSYFLIGYRWERPADTAAAVKAFLMTRAGDVGFLFGIFVLGLAAGSFRVSAVLGAAPGMSRATVVTGTLLLVFGVVAKSAQFPLHSWLPDAMAGPAPVSALIHAATMVAAGAYVVALLYPVFLLAPAGMAVLAVLAAISMLGAALAALAVDDLKRALAYSTISQLGFVLAVLAVGGRQEGVAHLLAHGAFKALLFLGSGVVLLAAGSTTLARLGGLRRAMPVTFVTMTVGFAALAGVPPTSGFFSKDAILTTLIDTARAGDPVAIFVLACALPTVAITAAYATRVWLRTFFGPPGIAVTPPGLVWPLVFLAIPALLLGVAVVWLGALRSDALSTELSVSLVAVGIAASWLAWRRAPRTSGLRTFLARAGYTDDLYERTVVPVVMRLARGVVHVDDHGVERAVIGVGRSARRLGGALRLIQNGNVQAYATGLFFGVLVLAFGVVVLR